MPVQTLADLRHGAGLSLREVQRRTGIKAPYLSEIERGIRHPHGRMLRLLSELYGVDPDGWALMLVRRDGGER